MWIWIAVAVGVFVALIIAYRLLVGLGRARVDEVQDRLGAGQIRKMVASANCFGVESGGYGQIRGNGVLALTDEELYFLMWIPKREIRIPLEDVIEVSTPKTHLGKTKMQPLLKISFTNREGESDSVAWLVPDLEDWTRETRNLADL